MTQATIPAAALETVIKLQRGEATITEPVLGPGGAKVKWWCSAEIGAGSNAAVDTTFDLPANSIVHDVIVEVKTAEATGSTKTLDVGLLASESGGDADGFVDGISVAATGYKRPTYALDGGNAYFASTTRGVLLARFVAGTDADDRGLYAEKEHVAGSVTAKSVVYTRGDTFVEFRGHVWILYSEFPTR